MTSYYAHGENTDMEWHELKADTILAAKKEASRMFSLSVKIIIAVEQDDTHEPVAVRMPPSRNAKLRCQNS